MDEYTPPEGAVLVGNKWVSPETGEVLGVEGPRPMFAVVDFRSAEWVMEQIQRARFAAAAAERRAKVVAENLERERRAAIREADMWIARYGAQMEAILPDIVARGMKSVPTAFGRFGRQTRQASVKIANENAAVEWCKEHAPDALRERVRVELVTTPLVGRDDLPPDIFISMPKRDEFFIRTDE